MHSSRLRLRGSVSNSAHTGEEERCVRDCRVLELSQELDQSLPQRGHDICRVVHSQATNEGHGRDAVLEDFVVDSDEERPDILGLRKMLVETLMQR